MLKFTRVLALAAGLAGLLASAVQAEGGETARIVPFEAVIPDGVIAGEIHQIGDTSPDTVVIVSGGSGVGERQDTAAAIGLFLNETTAVAIYDRRGFGGSSGEAVRPGTENSAWLIPALGADLAAIAAHLDGLGYERIGLVGSSMGGWINAAAAARTTCADFAVSIVGGAVPVAVSDMFDALTDRGLSIEDALEQTRSQAPAIGYDPATDLASASIPMIWVLAERDDSNPSRLDIEAIERFRAEGQAFAYILVEGADHNFRDVETGDPALGWVPEIREFVATAGR